LTLCVLYTIMLTVCTAHNDVAIMCTVHNDVGIVCTVHTMPTLLCTVHNDVDIMCTVHDKVDIMCAVHNDVDILSMTKCNWYPQKAPSLVFLQIQIVTSVVLNHHFTLQFAVLRHRLWIWRPWHYNHLLLHCSAVNMIIYTQHAMDDHDNSSQVS